MSVTLDVSQSLMCPSAASAAVGDAIHWSTAAFSSAMSANGICDTQASTFVSPSSLVKGVWAEHTTQALALVSPSFEL